ncbi:MAG: type II toxin-antitoxin system VapB family antitoxin [Thermoanaerobaculia bacterium]
MKRTNVILDEKLLDDARRVTGERTYSATITNALRRVVRQEEFRRALDEFQREAAKGDFFWPGYLEEIRPNAYSVLEEKEKKRVSAHEKRAPQKKSRRRASR